MMRKLAVASIMLAILVLGALFYTSLMEPAQRPPSAARIAITPERIARGNYLVEHVTGCLECHSERSSNLWTYPPIAGTLGGGSPKCYGARLGFPGEVCFPNITPDPEHGIGKWSDGEIVRAIREGVSADGRALFPLMPYSSYRYLSDEDVQSIVVYLKSIAPISERRPRTSLDFPVNIVIKFAPKPLAAPVPSVDPEDGAAYGRYLTAIAGCEECHTPVDDHHGSIRSKAFSGGQEFILDDGSKVVSANITPHATGLADIARESFVARFKAFDNPDAGKVEVKHAENTVMPWLVYAGMTEDDLAAIYDFLRTVAPIENRIERGRHPGEDIEL
jgi:hypothetical protein